MREGGAQVLSIAAASSRSSGNVGAMLGNGMMVVLNSRSKAARTLAFCAMGWAGIGSAFLLPCLWIKGTGSMFRAATPTADVAPVAEEKQPQVAPSSMPGPQPSFVPAPMTFQPTMGQPVY